MFELRTLESIIQDMPDGATHIDCSTYLKFEVGLKGGDILLCYNVINQWVNVDSLNVKMRSLADIQKQINQLKEIEMLKDTIDSLDKHLASAKADGIRGLIKENSSPCFGVEVIYVSKARYVAEQLEGKC